MKGLRFFVLCLLAGVLLGAELMRRADEAPGPAEPAPSLAAQEVVRIQLAALRSSDEAGIETAFRFASPGNRAVTGPLARFGRMVRSAPYAPLLGHRSATLGEAMALRDGALAVPVVITAADGSAHGFVFLLSRQGDASCDGCWMTDGVVPHPPVVERPAGRLI